jgi:hypothetical protein
MTARCSRVSAGQIGLTPLVESQVLLATVTFADLERRVRRAGFDFRRVAVLDLDRFAFQDADLWVGPIGFLLKI